MVPTGGWLATLATPVVKTFSLALTRSPPRFVAQFNFSGLVTVPGPRITNTPLLTDLTTAAGTNFESIC